MTRATLLAFLRGHRLAVETSVASGGGVQAAVVGIAVIDNFELVFDTLETTRKARNIALDPRVAFVIGGTVDGEAVTVQYEGVADRPSGEEMKTLQQRYLEVFPDGAERLSWPGLIYVRVKPRWLRYSDYGGEPPIILEWSERDLEALV
ncbi:MAG: pyridoxamine 5'-phosphate oxidase family protein [Gemmatimonadota bacterium]